MTKRSKDWNEGLAKDLKDPVFAAHFISSCIEESIPIQTALGRAIRTYGILEFSRKTHIPSPNIIRAINPRYNPTQETLSRLLKGFGLKLTVAPIRKKAA